MDTKYGLPSQALEDNFITFCVKGAVNKDKLVPKEPEGVIEVGKIREIREWLKRQRKHYEEKRFLWCICTFLFMGSLRPTESYTQSS